MERLKSQTACSSVDSVYSRSRWQALISSTASHNKYNLKARLQLERHTNFAEQLYCRATADKQDQLDHGHPALPDISKSRPELQQQWHADSNKHLGGIKVKPYSQITVTWHCNQCPAGQPHVWTARVDSRRRGSNPCPYCTNRLVCLHNSLATVAPDVAQYWSHSKNTLSPQQVVAGSNLKAEWKCPACKLEWQAQISHRSYNSSGCPKCSRALIVPHSLPTFAEAQPRNLVKWDFERNDAQGVYPDKTTLSSNKMVHWICLCCPRGQPHRWQAAPYSRTGEGAGCPV